MIQNGGLIGRIVISAEAAATAAADGASLVLVTVSASYMVSILLSSLKTKISYSRELAFSVDLRVLLCPKCVLIAPCLRGLMDNQPALMSSRQLEVASAVVTPSLSSKASLLRHLQPRTLKMLLLEQKVASHEKRVPSPGGTRFLCI